MELYSRINKLCQHQGLSDFLITYLYNFIFHLRKNLVSGRSVQVCYGGEGKIRSGSSPTVFPCQRPCLSPLSKLILALLSAMKNVSPLLQRVCEYVLRRNLLTLSKHAFHHRTPSPLSITHIDVMQFNISKRGHRGTLCLLFTQEYGELSTNTKWKMSWVNFNILLLNRQFKLRKFNASILKENLHDTSPLPFARILQEKWNK